MRTGALMLACVLGQSTAAGAQGPGPVAAPGPEAPVVVVLRPHADPGVDADMQAWGLDALRAGLVQAGRAVRDQTDMAGGLPAELRGCQNGDCALQARAALDCPMVAFLRFFSVAGGQSVSVVLADESDTAYQGTAQTGEGMDIGAAVGEALQDALSKARRGRGPWLTLAGEPEGALVLINERPVGRVPTTVRLQPGPANLEVRADGFASYRTLLHVRPDYDNHRELRVVLEPAPVASAPVAALAAAPVAPDAPRGGTSFWDQAIGFTALAAGALYAGFAIGNAVSDGDCAGALDQAGACGRRTTLGARFWSQVAGSALLLGGGAAMLTLQPIGTGEGESPGAALAYRSTY